MKAEQEPVGMLQEDLRAAVAPLLLWDTEAFAAVWLICSKLGSGWLRGHAVLCAAAVASALSMAELVWLAWKVGVPHSAAGQ